jgi:hypothetical protein
MRGKKNISEIYWEKISCAALLQEKISVLFAWAEKKSCTV